MLVVGFSGLLKGLLKDGVRSYSPAVLSTAVALPRRCVERHVVVTAGIRCRVHRRIIPGEGEGNGGIVGSYAETFIGVTAVMQSDT